MPYVAVPDKNSGDVFTTAMWSTYLEGNLNAGVDRPLYDSGVLGVATASIVISGIAQTFAALKVVVYGRGDIAGTNAALWLRLNGDTGANYDYEYIEAFGATLAAGEGVAVAQLQMGEIPGNTAPANVFSACEILIPNYTNAVNHKSVVASCSGKRASTTGNILTWETTGHWRSTAAITSVTVQPSSGNLAAGSRVLLYGKGAM